MPTRRETLGSRVAQQLDKNPGDRAAVEDAEQRELLIDKVVRLRKESGMSQAEVARRMNTTQSSVSEFEKATVDPRISTLQKYVRAIGSRIDFQIWRGPLLQLDTWVHRAIDYSHSSDRWQSRSGPVVAEEISTAANRSDRSHVLRAGYGVRVKTSDARIAPQMITDQYREGYVRSLAKATE
jgi:transcriptional regulator with XRE-family HTH domain